MRSSIDDFKQLDLRGVTVWLSGAIPEPDVERTMWHGAASTIPSSLSGALPQPKTDVIQKSSDKNSVSIRAGSESEDGILDFVQSFSSLLFRYGGQLIHGCQENFTPILVDRARTHRRKTGESPLHLAVSGFFSSTENNEQWKRWRQVADLKITPPTTPPDRDGSLEILREYMSHKCTAFVAIGGKWWDKVPGRAGVPKELQMAKARKIPCYVLGGFGGISSKFIDEEPEWYSGLNNELSVEDNQLLASLTDITLAAGILIGRLSKQS